jgi:two-component system, LuxR family, sensor kinase FixL
MFSIKMMSQHDNPYHLNHNGCHSPPAELLLQSAVDALPSHIAILNEAGAITSVNVAWRRFGMSNGYDHDASGIGTNYIEICDTANGRDAEEAHMVACGIRDISNERNEVFRLEYPCHSPKVRRWFTLQVARFEWEGQLRVITAHQNVTDLKLAQQAFAQSQQRLQTVVDTVVDGIFVADEKGMIESVNPAFCEIFSYQPETIIGKSVQMLMTEMYGQQYISYIRRHRSVNSRRYAEVGHEVTGVRRNGDTFPLYMAMSRAFVGNRWIFTGIVQDLTPRKRMEHEILEREKLQIQLDKEREVSELKNRFMSMISHELRTPLSVIQLSSDFLRRYADRMTAVDKEEAISTIQTQVKHLENMVDDVSALSRAEALDMDIRTETIDLLDLCRDVVANAQMLANDTHKIHFNGSPMCAPMVGDTKLLRQAFSNLLSNAVKYSDPRTNVYFTIKCHREMVEVSVRDEGIGIPEEDQPKLFQPFHRASNVEARQGTGLGLAVTKRAIELHGGTIDFKSKANRGTVFTIKLPLSDSV